MCGRCDQQVAELTADLAALDLDRLELDLDIADGLVPAWARRGLTTAERAARVNFAALDAAVDRRAGNIIGLLRQHRDLLADAVVERLTAAGATPADVQRAVLDLLDPARPITADVDQYAELTARLEAGILGELEAAHAEGAAAVRAEAAAQGIPVRAADVLDAAVDLAGRASAAASAPARAAIDGIGKVTGRAGLWTADVEALIAEVEEGARHAGDAGLERDAARTPAQQAHGAGRRDATRALPNPGYHYASELLDGATCGPCSLVDGRRYETLDAADEDYPPPGGTYRGCQGGERCRGTIVTVWDTEAAPTIDDAPEPPADGERGGPPIPDPPAPAPAPEPVLTDRERRRAEAAARAEADALELGQLADTYGIPVDQVVAARADVAAIQQAIRTEAGVVAQLAEGYLDGTESAGVLAGALNPSGGYLTHGRFVLPPPRKLRSIELNGRRNYVRVSDGQSWDWADGWDGPAQARANDVLVKRGRADRWKPGADEPSDRWSQAFPDGEIPDALDMVDDYIAHADLADVARGVARGTGVTPLRVSFDDVAPTLAGEGFDVATILRARKGDDLDAIVNVLNVREAQAAREAVEVARYADDELLEVWRKANGSRADYIPEHGPAPWDMSPWSYEGELLDVEAAWRDAEAAGVPVPDEVRARWLELVPIDDRDPATGRTLTAGELHETLSSLARTSGRAVKAPPP